MTLVESLRSSTLNNKLNVALIIGTRPEAIKLAPVALALRECSGVQASIWCTGQHPGWAVEMLGHFGLAPDRVLDISQPSGLAHLCSAMLSSLRLAVEEDRPDVVVVQGDTSSAFAGALAAAYAGVALVHVEAGLRSGNRHVPFPEEAHRRSIAHFTIMHCAPTQTAVDTLLAEGIPSSEILYSGNTVIDALRLIQNTLPQSGPWPESNRLVLMTCHRRESWGEPYRAVCSVAQHLGRRGDCDVMFVVHPNPALSKIAQEMLQNEPRIHLTPPLGYPEFINLLRRATLVLTDSGGIQEEAAAFGIPLLVLRDTTERPEGVLAGTARLIGTSAPAIIAAADALLDDPNELDAMRIPCSLYGDGYAATRIAAAILERWAERSSVSVPASVPKDPRGSDARA